MAPRHRVFHTTVILNVITSEHKNRKQLPNQGMNHRGVGSSEPLTIQHHRSLCVCTASDVDARGLVN